MTDFHASLTAALARSAAPAERFAAVRGPIAAAVHDTINRCCTGPAPCPFDDDEVRRVTDAVLAALAAVADDGLAEAWAAGWSAGASRRLSTDNPYRAAARSPAPSAGSDCKNPSHADDGLAGRVRALADEWDGYGHGVYCIHLEEALPCSACDLLAELRALLSPAPSADRDERDGAECSCAMTEGSQRRCPVHGEDDYRLTPPAEDGA